MIKFVMNLLDNNLKNIQTNMELLNTKTQDCHGALMWSELKVLEKDFNYLRTKYEKLTKEWTKLKEEKKHAVAEDVAARNCYDNLLKKMDLHETSTNAQKHACRFWRIKQWIWRIANKIWQSNTGTSWCAELLAQGRKNK